MSDEERRGGMKEVIDRLVENEKSLALIDQRSEGIEKDVSEIKASLSATYVTKVEFDPIKKIVWMLMSLILSGFVGSIIYLMWRK